MVKKKNGGLARHALQSQLTVNGLVHKRWKSKGRTPPQIHKNGAFRKRMSSFIDAMQTIHENLPRLLHAHALHRKYPCTTHIFSSYLSKFKFEYFKRFRTNLSFLFLNLKLKVYVTK